MSANSLAGQSGDPSLLPALDGIDVLERLEADRMAQYGLDEGMRSALRAFGGHCRRESGLGGVASALNELLTPDVELDPAGRRAYARFVQALSELPERDFDRAWMLELLDLWSSLSRAGFRADFPLRAARGLIAATLPVLASGRESFSRVDARIASALTQAGLFIGGMMVEATGRPGAAAADAGDAGRAGGPLGREVSELVAEALESRTGGCVGLLIGRMVLGAVALTMDGETGGELRAEVLQRLRGVLRERDIVRASGSSGFVAILPQLRSQAQVMLAANRLVGAFEAPIPVAGREARVGVRVGGAWAPEHGETAEKLLRHARLAAHEAQRLGRRMHLFDPALVERAEADAESERQFVRALDNGLLAIHFQPQLDLRSGQCVGAETLLRWTDGSGQAVSPPRILDIAERVGAAPQLTRWIVHRACRAQAELARAGIDLGLSVNLTASDVGDPELPMMVGHALELWRARAAKLTFELTESAMLANQSEGASVLARLRELGAATSIDDFGTGYSSVLYLRELPLNELKIDQSFVRRMVTSPQDREIVRSLIHLAHGLELEVVAEGIEDEQTLGLLAEMGCERGQGYVIGRPQPLEALIGWIAGRKTAG